MDLKFTRSARQMMPWLPLIARRSALYAGFSTALLIFAGFLAFLEGFAGPWFSCGFAMMSLGLYFGFRTSRRLQKIRLIRVQTETFASIPWILTGNSTDADGPQIARAKAQTIEAFPDNDDLILTSKLVPIILCRTTDTLLKVGKIMPFQPATQWRNANRAVLRRGLGYVADALMVRTLQHSEGNPYDEARKGILIYGSHWRTMLRAGMRLAFRGWAFASVAVLIAEVLALTSIWLFGIESLSSQLWIIGTALYMGCALKWSFFDPVAALITGRLLASAEEQEIDGSGWEARVEIASHEFVILKNAAKDRSQRVQAFQPAVDEASETADVG